MTANDRATTKCEDIESTVTADYNTNKKRRQPRNTARRVGVAKELGSRKHEKAQRIFSFYLSHDILVDHLFRLGPIDGDFGSPDDETLTHELPSRHRRGAMILVLDEGESAILRLIGDARVDDRVDDAVRESTHLVEYVRLGDLLRYAADEESTVVDGDAYAQRSTAAYFVVVERAHALLRLVARREDGEGVAAIVPREIHH